MEAEEKGRIVIDFQWHGNTTAAFLFLEQNGRGKKKRVCHFLHPYGRWRKLSTSIQKLAITATITSRKYFRVSKGSESGIPE
jgi:hypothetical protein